MNAADSIEAAAVHTHLGSASALLAEVSFLAV
jgi:hypothetical protein